MSGPLTKARLLELFDRLNEKLRQADQHGEVYIVGGAMMALAHDAKRVTADIDSHIRQGREALTKAVAEIADEEGLSRHWLNEAVTLRHLPEDPDRGARRVYDNTHLTIEGASTSRMIAMKLHAGRPPDLADLDILLEEAGVKTRQEAVRVHALTYGTEPMAAEADLYLIERDGRRPPDRDIGPAGWARTTAPRRTATRNNRRGTW